MTSIRLPIRRRRRRIITILFGAVMALVFFFAPLVRLLAEWPWFSALGYERVFGTRLIASLLLGIVTGGLSFAFLYGNLRFAQRGVVPKPIVMQMNAESPAVNVTGLLRRLTLPIAALLSLFIGMAVSTPWMPVLEFLHRTPFGVSDPGFGPDVSYYVFTPPVVRST